MTGGIMRRILGAAAGALSLAAVIAGTSSTAASASTAGSRIEHYQFVSVSATSPRASAIAWGTFTAGGTINLNTGLIRFPRGTFRAIHHRTSGASQFNRRTCLLVSVEHGTYKLADGTGKYRHISGSGTYTSRVWAVFARNAKGRCSKSRPPRAFQNVINARGPVRGVPSHGTSIHPWVSSHRSARRAG
jgi:hypothetical protein